MKHRLTWLLLFACTSLFSQVITPFSIRYQVTQKGGIRYLSNTASTCSGGGCGAGRTEVPPAGTSTDNGFTAAYVDVDADGTTFQSSSDSISLPTCSEISWAGLYWGGEMNNTGANYATRNQCKIKTNNGAYVNLTADAFQDNAVGFDTYHCFKDITTIVRAGGTNARYTIANVAVRTGGTNRFGGWSIVIVYKNDLQPMRNLTVFNGLSNVSGSNPITDITVSGFLTPLSGPVTFEVGDVTYDGDRSSTGDQLMFNGGSGFVNISDAVNPLNDIFNSTYSYNGVQKVTPFINPGYTNSLGFDADIFVPNNVAKNYIGNSATSATLRLTTGGETFLTQVVSMAIDVYEPDLRAACRVRDINGGTVQPGDTLEYTIVGKNIGSDPAVNTFITDTLEYNAIYVPGSLRVTYGPNSGNKTDATADDQGEYVAAQRLVKVRIGTGANGVTGGQINNSALGIDSTQIKFRATATTDCVILQCDNIINNRAYIFGTGNVSGNSWSNGSNPDIFDGSGCPVPGTTTTPISAASCPAISIGSNSPVCTGATLNLTSAPASTSATYSWTGPGGFTSSSANPTRASVTAAAAGTYTCVISTPGSVCSYTLTTVVAINTTPATPSPSSNTPVCTGNTINLSTAAVAGATYSWTGPSSFTSALQNPTRAGATTAMGGTYSVTVTSGGCTSAAGTTVVVVNTTPATPSPSSNTPVCTGNTINLSTAAVAGATYSWTGPSAFASSVQNPTRTNATTAMAGTYSVTVTANGCTSGVGTTVVVINTTPATPSPSSNTPVCSGNTINLSTAAVAGATYSWTGPNSFSSSVQNPAITNATTAMDGTYSVTVTTNGCTSAVGTTAVVVNSTPATPSPSSNTPVCTGNTINLSTAAVAGATYSWTGPNSFTSAVQNPTITNATTAMAGTYSVTVTANGCTSAVGTTAVVVNTTPATPSPSSNTPVCTSNTINLSTAAVAGATYSWTGPNSFSSSVQNPAITNATTAMAGTYSVTVTTNGCTSAVGTTAVVVNSTPATPSPSSNTPVCTGNTINLSTAAVAGATYSWTGPNSFSSSLQNPTITNATTAMAGTYSVTVTTNGCTSAVGTTAVVVNSTPATPSPSSNTPVCTGNTINLSTAAVAGATYSWTGPSAFSSSLQNPTRTNATTAMAGTYSVTVTANGCTSGVGATTVVVNTTPATPSPSSNTPVCTGNTINLSTAAVAGATYSWTGPNSFSSAVQNPAISNATTAMAGTYSVTVTTNGCTSATGTTTVVVNTTPSTPSPSSNTPVCTGNTINLSTAAVAGATYSWTGPSAFSSSLQNPTRTNATTAMAGTYSVTVTANGCTSGVGTTTVVVNTTPATPSPSSNTPVCTGNTINLSTAAVAGATYSWTGPNSFSSAVQNPAISNATTAMAGTYSVTVTTNGCTSTAGTTAVVVNTTPVTPSPSSNSPVCSGNTLNLSTSAVAGATYSWTGPNSFSSSVQNPTISNATTAATGTYSLAVTANGCTSAIGTTAVIVANTPSTPSLSSNSPVCTGNTLNLSTAAVAGATYSWTGPNGFSDATQNPSVSSVTTAAAGTYSLVISIGGCASGTGTTAVTINTTPATPSLSSNSPVCSGNTLNLSTSAVAGATYSWTGPNGFSDATQNPSIASVTTAADGTYSLTVTANGCTSSAGTTAVTVNATPSTPVPSANSPVCSGNALNLSTAAVAGATYAWSGPNGFSSSSQNPTIAAATTAAGGTYSVVITVTGCSSLAGMVIAVVDSTPATPSASGNAPICSGNALNLSTVAVAGATYSWTGPNGFTDATQNPSIASATTAASGTYSVTVTVGNCTSAAGTYIAVVDSTPATPVASGNSPICSGNALNLSTVAVTGATYSWTGPNGFSDATQNPSIASATTAASGTYSVTLTVGNCTSAAGTYIAVVDSTPATPSASGNSPICSGSTLNLSTAAVTGATYSWTGPNGFSDATQNPSIASATTAASGTYSVTVTVGNCTSAAGTYIAVVDSTPAMPSPLSNSPICSGNALNLSTAAVTGATYSWTGPNGFSDATQNPSIIAATTAASGTYSVTITVGNCTSLAGTISATVDSTPATPVITINSPVCTGNAVNLSIDTVSGASYSWNGPNGFTSTSQNPSIVSVALADSGSYNVVVTLGGCASATGIATLVVNATPAAPTASSNSPVCAALVIDLFADTIPGAAYSWTGPNGFTSSLQNPVITNCTTADSGMFAVTITMNGCTSSAATTNVIVNTCTDADNDGTFDNADPDDDNDGVLDIVEGTIDTDGDGIPNYLDLDSDNDGITDVAENGGADANGDGIIDGFVDVDGDGLADLVDPTQGGNPLATIDMDGDGILNYIDLDSDNDGIADVTETGGADTNNDGILDATSDANNNGLDDSVDPATAGFPDFLTGADTNNDGLADSWPNDNTDNSGGPNFLDLDSDNDGITDNTEAQTAATYIAPSGTDSDGDGIDDAYDAINGFGGAGIAPVNSDATGGEDYIDLDSDDDGIVDNIEAQPTAAYIAPSGNDTDGDGIDDAYDAFNGFGGPGVTPANTDGNDNPDYTDTDSDNDGFTDLVEGNDFNNDNQPDVAPSGLDSDNDGLDNAYDNVSTTGTANVTNNDAPPTGTTFPDVDQTGGDLDWRSAFDTDGDGISNVDDIDDDNDGILDVTEFATASNLGDTDGDGIPDSLDLDSDNDGIADIIEANGSDPDNDGMVGVGPITDANNDGLDDSLAPNGLPGVDTDADGHPDFQDLDADNDGINDLMESGGGQLDANSDGVVDGPDSDADGLPDASDSNNGGNLTANPRDFDGDNVDDYRDLDSDNDGINDVVESGNGASDTNSDGVVDGTDADNDGIRDAVDANDALFGDPDTNDTPGDFDSDNHPDYNDIDSDNDGINDVEESGTIFADANSDGVVDGTDTDGDGILDLVDANDNLYGDPDTNDTPGDFDSDGHPDYTDLDSDNDGINDVVESGNGSSDTNSDGVVDGTDTDGDGSLDPVDANDNLYGDPDTNDTPGDFDSDGHPDYTDLDSDNDGINDVVESGNEASDTNSDGVVDGTDTDGDGILDPVDANDGLYGDPDTNDTPGDVDGDGHPDYTDLDSDNDGINDVVESGNGTLDANGDGIVDGSDTDGDGIFDPADANDNLYGDPDTTDTPTDTDNDGQPDYTELDSDNDGITDVIESGNGGLDTDHDGMVDGPDSDGDGIVDPVDGNNGVFGDAPSSLPDTDGDGTPNFQDTDSDGDGVNDGTNGENFSEDCDNDGIMNYYDPDPCNFIVPNGFSPNGDNINDYFEIVGIGAFPKNKVTIFNRWGNIVYDAAGYNNGSVRWEGNNAGDLSTGNGPVPEGTYFYVIDLGDGSPVLSGYVFLNRQ